MLVVEKVRPQSLLLQQLAIMSQVLGQSRVPRVAIRKDTRQRLLWADFDSPGRGLFMVKNDQSFWGSNPAHVNATSTRIRRFGAIGVGENRSMSAVVGMGNV